MELFLAFISDQLLFFSAVALVLFLPGYFLLTAIFGKEQKLLPLEKIIFSLGLSLFLTNVTLILLSKLLIPITRLSVFLSLTLICVGSLVVYLFRNHRKPLALFSSPESDKTFSSRQIALIILLLVLTLTVRVAYLRHSVLPTATDLGHHMYWAKSITETGSIPVYAKENIIQINESYEVAPPAAIADFIIGEHLIFSAIQLLSGISFFSAFPVTVLLLINLFSLLTVFLLALRLFQDFKFGKSAAILVLLFIGPLYAVASPQAKFVSGGVIGNILGNFLLPLALLAFARALMEKNRIFLLLGLIFSITLAYTHHLTALIFLFVLLFSAIIFALANFKKLPVYLKEWAKLIFSPSVGIFFLLTALFFLFVYTPTYVAKDAVSSAVGAPTKLTRTGLTFSQLRATAGEARMALGLVGLAILGALAYRRSYGGAIVLGWSLSLLIMSLWPKFLLININSSRVANYISYPLALAAGFALAWLFFGREAVRRKTSARFSLLLAVVIFAFVLANGLADSGLGMKESSNAKEAVQTFHAAQYLSEEITPQDGVVKDHINLVADAWIKLFFMQDYNFPFSRAYLKRYEDETNRREMCTLWMISTPNLTEGKKCFEETGTNFILVNPRFDGVAFEKSPDFWKVYTSQGVAIYRRVIQK